MAKRYNAGDLSETEILDKLIRYCDFQERCRKDIFKKGHLLGLKEEEIPAYISRLEDLGYLSEKRFVHAFISGKYHIKKWGLKRIERELKIRAIPPELYANKLDELQDDNYLEQFRQVAAAKWEKIKGRNLFEKKAKLFRFLYGRGYESELIKEFLNDL